MTMPFFIYPGIWILIIKLLKKFINSSDIKYRKKVIMKILANLFPESKIDTTISKNIKAEPHLNETEETIKGMFDQSKTPLTEKNLEDVKAFLKNTPGDMKSKLETVQLALDKGIEITPKHLSVIHTALNSQTAIASDVIQNIEIKTVIKELPSNEKEQVKAEIKKGSEPREAVEKVVSKVLESMMKDSTVEIKTDQSIEEDPDVLSETDEISEEEKLVIEVLEILSDDLDEMAKELIPLVNKELFTTPLPIRKVVEREITSKMIELKDTFETYQKVVSSQLNELIEGKSVSAKEVLNAVVDKLDHIILKTDIPLHTDIKTERDLLQSSGRLEIARTLIDSDEKKAIEIIKEVKTQIDQISFKPQKKKMYGVTKQLVYEKLYDEALIKSIPIKLETMSSSPRMVLETLRDIGLNHEPEISEKIRNQEKIKAPHNFKAVLLKLEENTSQKVLAKDHLENMTGQQLVNKLEINSQKQKMILNIPLTIDGDVKNLKVHVDAKKDQEKIDWKNSRLYFVIHLDKLGDTGVLVDVKHGNASITIKNDTPHIQQKMMRYVNQAKDRLHEVGFQNINVRFETLFKEKTRVELKKEGFDVTI